MTAVQGKKRVSRFHTANKSSQPPHLSQVIRAIKKQSGTTGELKGAIIGQRLRAIAASVNRWYHDKGKADDLVRFLQNTGIVIQGTCGGAWFYDAEQAQHVLDCCESGIEPQVQSNPDARIAVLVARNTTAAKKGGPKPAPRHSRPEPTACNTSVEVNDTAPTTTTESEQPASDSEAPISLVDLPELTPAYVLFLTPAENDIWESLLLASKSAGGEWRIGIWKDAETLYEEWSGSPLYTLKDLDAALERFIRHGFLEYLGPTSKDRATHAVKRDLRLYHVIRIEERETQTLKPSYERVIRLLRTQSFTWEGHSTHIKEWFSTNFPELNPDTLYTKFVNYDPGQKSLGLGILIPSDAHQCILCGVEGFGRFEYAFGISASPPTTRRDQSFTSMPKSINGTAPPFDISSKPLDSMSDEELSAIEKQTRQEIARLEDRLTLIQAAKDRAVERNRLRQELEAVRSRESELLAQLEALNP